MRRDGSLDLRGGGGSGDGGGGVVVVVIVVVVVVTVVVVVMVVIVVVVEMERRAPQVPPALLKPTSCLDPVTRVCSRIRSTWRLVHNSGLSAGVSSSRKPSADKASPARSFRSAGYLLHCTCSHLTLF